MSWQIGKSGAVDLVVDVELDGTEQITVVGECHRRHVQRLGALEQWRDLDCTIEERVLGVQMKMDERLG